MGFGGDCWLVVEAEGWEGGRGSRLWRIGGGSMGLGSGGERSLVGRRRGRGRRCDLIFLDIVEGDFARGV